MTSRRKPGEEVRTFVAVVVAPNHFTPFAFCGGFFRRFSRDFKSSLLGMREDERETIGSRALRVPSKKGKKKGV